MRGKKRRGEEGRRRRSELSGDTRVSTMQKEAIRRDEKGGGGGGGESPGGGHERGSTPASDYTNPCGPPCSQIRARAHGHTLAHSGAEWSSHTFCRTC